MKAIALWLLRELKRCLFVLIYGGRRSHADYAIVNLEGSRHPSPLTTVYHKLQPTNACPYTFLQELLEIKKENLCLYGYPSEQWEVNLSAEEVPAELPEACAGHKLCWGWPGFGFDRADKKPFFNMINELPTIFEVVTGTKKQLQEKSSGSNHGGNNSKSNSKAVNNAFFSSYS
ncbi:hypothetical protein K1719_023381 [Acacia pycnantha]|nr:hypothetical protein K1719_023381 [Acacia pycnantha]